MENLQGEKCLRARQKQIDSGRNRFVHLVTKITGRKETKRTNSMFVAFMDLNKSFERVDNLFMLNSLISYWAYLAGPSNRIENFLTRGRIKVKIQ